MASRSVVLTIAAVVLQSTSSPADSCKEAERAACGTVVASFPVDSAFASTCQNHRFRECIDEAFTKPNTFKSSAVSSELLQIVGQIVVDRAKEAGMSILQDKVMDSLNCGGDTTSYPRTCKVLGSLRIHDLLSSPTVLLDAAMADLAAIFRGKLADLMARSKPFSYAVKLGIGVGGVMALWSTRNKDGAFDAVLDRVRDEIRTAAVAACPAAANDALDLASTRAAYGVGMCILSEDAGDSVKKRLEKCDLSVQLENCGKDDETTMAAAIALKNALTAATAADGFEGVLLFVTNGAAARQRELKDDGCFATADTNRATNLCAATIENVGEIGVGLARQDWTRVASGATALLNDYGKLKGDTVSGTRFFKLVAAIGQYALTYKSVDGSANQDATKARRDIIESLVKQMVDRSQRVGWVASVGGAFGAGYLSRKEIRGTTKGVSTFALPIGIGFQHYPHRSPVGFHAQLGVFDLGQYVTFEDNHEVTVGTPDPKAAIAFSATVGLWTPKLSKSVPLFIGAYGGVAPFVLANGKPEYFIGGIVGAYVPLLDF